jgi:hypothetical protein
MTTTAPSLFGSSASGTLGINTDGTLAIVSSKADDFIGAAIAPLVAPFNGGASVGVGLGHTLGSVALMAGAMLAENKLGLVNRVLPSSFEPAE